jgi:glycosyltransferase involved in cell wall biosynthesis
LIRPIHPYHDLKALFQIGMELKKIKPMIVHTHSSKAGIIGRFAATLCKIPIIIHSVHGFSFSPFQSIPKRNLYKWLEKKMAGKTSHFIFVSRNDLETARNLRLVKNNFSLIRSGFPLEEFLKRKANPEKLRKQFNIKSRDFVCGIIAPFKPQKGLQHLIEIAALLLKKTKDVVFFLAGDGELRPYIESELKKRNITEHFRLPGFIKNISQVIDIFDCGISTALWEGLPQSIVQMRLKKKCVVVSDIPGHLEIIQDNKNGFIVDICDHETFADKIYYLITHPKEKFRLARFQDNFSNWDAQFMVKEQEKLYNYFKKLKHSEEMKK